MMILVHRIQQRVPGPSAQKGVKALANVPSVITTLTDQNNLLPQPLADIARPKVARLAVKAHAPDVAQPIGPNLRAGPGSFHERVVFRNRVREIALPAIDIDADDRGEQRREVLTVSMGIVARPAVAVAHVQKSVRPEEDRRTVVVAVRLVDGEDHLLTGRIGTIRIVLGRAETGQHASFRFAGRVVDVELRVVRVVGVKGQREQTLLVVAAVFVVVDPFVDVEKHFRSTGIRSVTQRENASRLLDDEQALGLARRIGQEDRAIEFMLDKSPHQPYGRQVIGRGGRIAMRRSGSLRHDRTVSDGRGRVGGVVAPARCRHPTQPHRQKPQPSLTPAHPERLRKWNRSPIREPDMVRKLRHLGTRIASRARLSSLLFDSVNRSARSRAVCKSRGHQRRGLRRSPPIALGAG